jgi:hypothetical protein
MECSNEATDRTTAESAFGFQKGKIYFPLCPEQPPTIPRTTPTPHPQVFYHFPKYHMKILLGDFNEKVGRENILKPKTGYESLHQDSNDNGARIVNFATSKNLIVNSTMFPHRNIHNTPGPLPMCRLITRLITY